MSGITVADDVVSETWERKRKVCEPDDKNAQADGNKVQGDDNPKRHKYDDDKNEKSDDNKQGDDQKTVEDNATGTSRSSGGS